MRTLRSLALVLGVSLVAGSMGCVADLGSGPVEEEEKDETMEPPPGMAMLRVVHASPDAPAVDIWAGGAPLVTNLVYGGASAWLVVEPSAYDVEIKVAPSTAADPAVYRTGPLAIEEGEKVSAIAAGLVGSSEDANKIRVLPVREDFAPAGSGNAIVRVVHASPDAPSVGIDLHNDDPTSPELTNIDRFTDTAPSGFPLSAGEPLQIGIAAGGARVTAFTTPELPEGAELLVVATGLVGAPANEAGGFALLAIGPGGSLGFIRQNPFVYALHAGPDAPAVDLYAGEALLAGGLSFGQLAGPVQVPAGNYEIDFRVAGSDPASPPAVSAKTGELEAGNRYLSIATGFLASNGADGFRLASLPEKFSRDIDGGARVRVVHGAPDAPAVDLGILNVEHVVNPVLFGNLSFGGASSPEGLAAGSGTLPLGVTPAFANDQVVASFHVTAAPENRAFAVAAGALDPAKGQSFRLLVVDTASTPWTVATIHPQP